MRPKLTLLSDEIIARSERQLRLIVLGVPQWRR